MRYKTFFLIFLGLLTFLDLWTFLDILGCLRMFLVVPGGSSIGLGNKKIKIGCINAPQHPGMEG